MSKFVENNTELQHSFIHLLQKLDNATKMSHLSFLQLEEFIKKIKDRSITQEELAFMHKLLRTLDTLLKEYELTVEHMFLLGLFTPEQHAQFQISPLYKDVKKNIEQELIDLKKYYISKIKK